MKGRNGMELRGTKIALAAVLACLLSLTAWLGVSQMVARANGGATASGSARYDPRKDTVQVINGKTGEAYKFFTVANAKKKVPAANQWVTTDNGNVELSSKTGAAIYYFADSTSPAQSEIVAVVVPSVPTISKVSYSTTNKEFTVKVKTSYFDESGWKSNNNAFNLSSLDNVEYSVGNGDWSELSNLEGETLTKLQKNGAIINVRIKGSETNAFFAPNGSKGSSNAIESYSLLGASAKDSLVSVRRGASKQFKIAKAATGPSLSVDYANHLIKLKKGQVGYKEIDADSEASGDAIGSTDAATIVSDMTPGVEDYYVVQTVKSNGTKSNYTHISIGADKPLASYNATALVTQVGDDAVLQIVRTPESGKTESDLAKEKFEYAVSTTNYVKDNSYFDYVASVDKNSKLTWKGLTAAAEKASATVTIKKSALKEGAVNVYVRRAAVTSGDKELSSRVVVFSRDDKGNWTVKEDYGDSEKKIANIEIKYVGDKIFSVKATNGNVVEGETVTIGTNIKFKSTASADAIADASADAVLVNSEGTLNTSANLSVKLSVPSGLVVSTSDVPNAAFTWSGKINTFVPQYNNKTTESTTSASFEFKSSLGKKENVVDVVIKKAASGDADFKYAKEETITDYTVSGKKITISGSKGEKIQLVSFKYKNGNYGYMTVKPNDAKSNEIK